MFLDNLIGPLTCLVLLLSCAGREVASLCVCTPSQEATPVYGKTDSLSEIVGNISANTCLHGDLVTGKEWLLLSGSSDYFIQIKKLTACPNDRVIIQANITMATKTTEANHHIEQQRFLLDSLNQAKCDFEVNSLCSWRNMHGHDDFDWVLYRASTPTDDTGPDFDHTTRNSSGSYIFTESSAPRNTLDTAWIESPTIEVTPDPVHCFRFWYHMYGSSIGRLNVYQVTNGGLPGNLVWSLTGDQGNSWKEGQVPFNSSQSYSILLSGVVGNGYQGDIAVDDVNVRVGYCDVKPPSASRTDVTNTTSTPVDGVWKTWTAWSICDVTCGGGSQQRTRDCYFPSSATHGLKCAGESAEKTACSEELCPVDGVLGEWSSWTTCSQTCGGGNQTRSRDCTFPGAGPHGKPCNGHTIDSQPCNPQVCTVDGLWSLWSSWSTCDVTCGNGTQSRTRNCTFPPEAVKGKNCTGGPDLENQPCSTSKCPMDGIWSTWSNYTECTVTCGGGTRARFRTCGYAPKIPQGDPCTGPNNETQQCNNDHCPVDGKLSAWGNWEVCSKSCANGTQSRHRTCDYTPPSAPHGKPCSDSLDETRRCHTEKCPSSLTEWM